MSDIVKALAVRGKLLLVGLAADPLEIDTLSLVSGMRSMPRSLIGSAIDEKDALLAVAERLPILLPTVELLSIAPLKNVPLQRVVNRLLSDGTKEQVKL